MLVEFGVVMSCSLERLVESNLLGWRDFLCRCRRIEGFELVMGNLERIGPGFSNKAIDSTTLETDLGLPALFSDFPDNRSLSQGVALNSP